VITLDLVMPRMNGVEFLRRQNTRRRIPVVICSIAHESGELALEALEAGAVDFVQKPTALATDRVFEIAEELVAKVIEAAKVDLGRAAMPPAARADALRPPIRPGAAVRSDVVVIGISTGGPQALRQLIPSLPADFPVPVAMVLHMPVGYTAMYAQRLNDICSLTVIEVSEGAPLAPGVVWLAPAGQHLTFVRDAQGVARAHLDLNPSDTQHRPAVDVLFRSAADVFGSRVLGVVMTGMGNDGLLGAAHIKAQGGRVVTESESSCVVYGMPRAVVEASLSDRSATLDEMASAITELI
jgi:two-component system chemotaxis response regulator CheB